MQFVVLGGVANIWMKWHQLEGFPLTYVLICHLGMIEQRLPPKGEKIFCERRLQRDSDVGVSTLRASMSPNVL